MVVIVVVEQTEAETMQPTTWYPWRVVAVVIAVVVVGKQC